MALHPSFPKSPYAILEPDLRWFPADEHLRTQGYEKLMPPLVAELRKKVKKWRDANYEGASPTSRALLRWWFETEHPIAQPDGTTFLFRYYFAQREAVETVMYLHDVAKARSKYDLMKFDSSGAISTSMFPEDWPRYVCKMATGSGKTKVLALLLAWSYFHKTYEPDSDLARNFLVIAPNIIVLDRLRTDFDGLKIFFHDPVLPDNGYEGQNWHDDFQVKLHIQDQISGVQPTGNIFLTNIHRVYGGDVKTLSAEDENTMDYFLGPKPVGKTNESKVDLGVVVRDIAELVVLNDEAHHIHDDRLAWFKSIQDIHNRLLMKDGRLALQIDVTATPKHDNGNIFAQVISDYPLVEAIHQNVVKHPVLPDAVSQEKLIEQQSAKFTEKYRDFLNLGVEEWRKVVPVHEKLGKKAVLFVMTDDTRNCDEVAEYLETTYSDLKNAVLVIHTKNNGEISEAATGRSLEELEKLRAQSNAIDSWESPYKAIVSVLMLKEGWDVRNVTTIVGLRAYVAKSNILPEQTLGRGLRRMYFGVDGVEEEVSVVGTRAFMEFVESIKSEGVELERKPMGAGTPPQAPLVVEVDRENVKKDIEKLDIEIPVLTPRVYREYKNLSELDPASFGSTRVPLQEFSESEKRQIVFRRIVDGKESHVTELSSDVIPDPLNVVGHFTKNIMDEMRLVSGYDALFPRVREFMEQQLFDRVVDLHDANTLRNLSELVPTRTIIESFRKAINGLTVRDRGEAELREYIRVSKVRPFVMHRAEAFLPKKSIFNRIVGDSHFENVFASFLDGCDDIVSFAKNYLALQFKIDYQNASGEISDYHPDFFVKVSERELWIVETKGREDLDDVEKWKRLQQWCVDVNARQSKMVVHPLLVRQEKWDALDKRPGSFGEAARIFRT